MGYELNEPDAGWREVYQWLGVDPDWNRVYIQDKEIWNTYEFILNERGLLRFDRLVDFLHSRKKARAIVEILLDMGLITSRNGWIKLKPAMSWHRFFVNKEEVVLHV